MERPKCGTCPYAAPDLISDDGLVCRRYPPAAHLRVRDVLYEHDDNSEWPTVHATIDWCGEHPDFPAYLAHLRGGRTAVASPLPGGDLDRTPIDFSELSVRLMNILETNSIRTYGQLVKMTRDDVECLRGMGPYSLHQLKEHLAARGLWLGDRP
jgi:hypothetical protein